MSAAGPEPRHCRLHAELGANEPCPEAACAFWEHGATVLPARCAFDRVDLAGRPDLASLLLQIRAKLEALQGPGPDA